MPVEIRLLGQVEAAVDGRPIDLGPPQQRALLALLALRPGDTVRVETLVDRLWPEDPPPSATKVVQTYVSRLRKALGPEAIASRDVGYALGDGVGVDVTRFRELVAAGRPSDALALWRGDALLNVPALDAEAGQLEEERLSALEECPRIDLAELRRLVDAHPERERLVGRLMIELYRAGRQAEALQTFRDTRRRLVDELGIEPGDELRELERSILRHDASLAPPAAQRTVATRRRRGVWGAAAVSAALCAVAILVAVDHGERRPIALAANTLVRIDARTNRIVQSIAVGRDPGGVTATGDAVWVASEPDRTVTRVDTYTGKPKTIGEAHPVAFLTHDDSGNIYTSGWDYPQVWQIDPGTVEIVRTYRVRTRALGLAVGGGSLWVVDRLANAVTRIDLARRRVMETIPVGADPLVLTFGFGSLWVANSDDATVSVIRPGVTRPATIDGLPKAFGIAAGEGAVWVGSNTLSTVYRVDPDTRQIVARIPVGRAATPSGLYDVAAGAGGVWAANRDDHDVVRIDPHTDKVVARIVFPHSIEPRSIAIAGDEVWVSVARWTIGD